MDRLQELVQRLQALLGQLEDTLREVAITTAAVEQAEYATPSGHSLSVKPRPHAARRTS